MTTIDNNAILDSISIIKEAMNTAKVIESSFKLLSPQCKHMNVREDRAVEDDYDPGTPYGHSQHEYRVEVCDDCGKILKTYEEDGWDAYESWAEDRFVEEMENER